MPPTPQPGSSRTLTQRAQTLIDVGRPDEAIRQLLEALRQTPENADTLCLLAQAHHQAGRHAEAEQWAMRAVAASPDSEWAHRLLAIQRMNQKRWRDAVAPAEAAVRLGPHQPNAWHALALVWLGLERLQDAQNAAERLRQIAPGAAITYETLGRLAMKRHHWDEAEAYLRHALSIDPESYYAHNNLGVSLLNRPAFFSHAPLRESIACFHRAVHLRPTEDLARRNLSRALNRYLSLRSFVLMIAAAVGITFNAGLHNLPATAVLDVGIAVVWLGIAARSITRYRSLPTPLREIWRRTWWTPHAHPYY